MTDEEVEVVATAVARWFTPAALWVDRREVLVTGQGWVSLADISRAAIVALDAFRKEKVG